MDLLNPCLSSPCLNSGMCITLMDDKGVSRGFLCRCRSPQDSGAYCEQRNFCFSNPCLNGGTCKTTPTGFTCQCPATWTGYVCNYPSDVSDRVALNCFDEGRRCLNGGSCLKYQDEFFYTCKCPPNYSGSTCETYEPPKNPCSTSNPCLNGGVCIFNPPAYFQCKCTDNFIGPNCERLNPCMNNTCLNNGVCRIDIDTNDYVCTCLDNYMGRNCQECKPQFAGPFCNQCANGYTGLNCDQVSNQCTPNPCNNGACILESNLYKCVCAEGKKYIGYIVYNKCFSKNKSH